MLAKLEQRIYWIEEGSEVLPKTFGLYLTGSGESLIVCKSGCYICTAVLQKDALAAMWHKIMITDMNSDIRP